MQGSCPPQHTIGPPPTSWRALCCSDFSAEFAEAQIAAETENGGQRDITLGPLMHAACRLTDDAILHVIGRIENIQRPMSWVTTMTP